MFIKTIIATALIAISLYSAETNAFDLKANKCTLGLLPFGTTMNEESKKQDIIEAYEAKGFFVTVLKNPNEVSDVEFISDASVDCTSTYFGIMAKTSVRLVETKTSNVVAKVTTPGVVEMFSCKIDLFGAINSLPSCQIK
ncbi:MAG: hypothetical protein K2Q18_13480 [Bdellovibrionales bacterium]|nr:hypothetical protein [Bdellovibrionales bacterium]